MVTPAVYALYDPRNAPAALRGPAAGRRPRAGGAALFVSGVDPGWGNDLLPVLVSGLAGEVEQVRCQEIFDYSTYDAPDAVRLLVGMGEPMDYEPPMVAPGVPTMVWGGQVRMIARALGVELDEVRETLERRPLEEDVTTALGLFEAGTQGALRFEVQGIVDGEPVIVVEHVTRIAPGVAPDWPVPPDGGDGAHKVVIEGRPAHRGQPRGHRRGRQPGRRRQRHRREPAGQRDPVAPRRRAGPLRRPRRTPLPRHRAATGNQEGTA